MHPIRRPLLIAALLLIGGGIFSALVLDPVWFAAIAADPPPALFWDRAVFILDVVTLKLISDILLGSLLIALGAVLLAEERAVGRARAILYVGLTHFTAVSIADGAKPLFGRMRPYEAMAETELLERWFVGAHSFPSGHTAFYAGLFLPLMVLFPRWIPVLAIIPVFVAVQRMTVHAHYPGDVLTSLGISVLMTAAFLFILRRPARPSHLDAGRN